jgi:hypothetical protein
MRPPWLRALQPRDGVERNPHGTHQSDVCRRRRDDALNDQRNDRRQGKAQNHNVQAPPAARPPRAGILLRRLNVRHGRHGHQVARGVGRRRHVFWSPTLAAVAAVPSRAIAGARRNTWQPRRAERELTSPKKQNSCRLGLQESLVPPRETVHGGLHRPMRPSYITRPVR